MTVAFPTFPTNHEPSADEFAALLPIYVRKTLDEPVTSNTTVQNDDELFVTVLANATYEMYGFIIYDGAAGTGLKGGFYGPTSATLDWMIDGNSGANTAASGTTFWGYSNISASNTWGTAGAGTKLICRPSGLLVTSSTAGTFGFQWAQGSSSVTAVHVFAGSYLCLRRVA